MPTYTRGTVATNDVNDARIVKDMSEDILLLDPSRTPFLVFSKRMTKKPTHNRKFYWQEDEVIGHRTAITSGETVTLTAGSESNAIEVDNVDIFTKGDMVLIEDSGVIGYVSDVEDTEANHIKIIPGFDDSSTDTDISGGEAIQRIGDANAEGGGLREENRRQIEEKWNYVQKFKKTFSMTEEQMATKMYNTSNDWAYLRKKKGIEHNEDIERALIWGGRNKITNTNIGEHPTTTTRGVINHIASNVETIGSSTALTESAWETFLRDKAFDHGSDKKLLLASPTLASMLSQWAKDNVQTKVGSNQKYGVNVTTYLSNLGYQLDVVVHKFLEGTTWGQAGIVLDMDAINLRVLKGNGKDFDTKLHVDIGLDSEDKQTDQYRTVLGLEMRQEKRHALIKNVLDNS